MLTWDHLAEHRINSTTLRRMHKEQALFESVTSERFTGLEEAATPYPLFIPW